MIFNLVDKVKFKYILYVRYLKWFRKVINIERWVKIYEIFGNNNKVKVILILNKMNFKLRYIKCGKELLFIMLKVLIYNKEIIIVIIYVLK